MNPEIMALVGAVVPTVFGVIIAVINQRGVDRKLKADAEERKKQQELDGKKIKADAADTLTDTAIGLIAPLKAEIAELRDNQRKLIIETGELRRVITEKDAEIASLKAEYSRFERRVVLLESLLVSKEADIAALKARVLLLEGVVTVKDNEIHDRDLKISTLETKVCQLEGEVAAMRAQLPDWKPEDGERRKGG